MEKLLIITKTELTLDEVKSTLDFNSNNFNLYTPFEFEKFKENDFFCKPYRVYKKDEYLSSDEKFPMVENIDLYEESSDEINNFFDNYIVALNEKHGKKYANEHIKIHEYNHQPFFIEAQYLLYDDDFNKSELVNENFEIKQNFKLQNPC